MNGQLLRTAIETHVAWGHNSLAVSDRDREVAARILGAFIAYLDLATGDVDTVIEG